MNQQSFADASRDSANPAITSFPTGCKELLPEDELFTEYLRNAARILALNNPPVARGALRIIALRDELEQELLWTESTSNIADTYIRAYLCLHFKKLDQLSMTTASPETADFILKKETELSKRIKSEILKLRKDKTESAQLSIKLSKTENQFRELRDQVIDKVRAELKKSEKK